MLIKCPSGLSGEIRKMSGKEGKLIADRRSMKGTFLADSILSGCFIKLEDPGPYGFSPGSLPAWSKVIGADRAYALVQIRALSLGDEYEFKVQCDNEGCRRMYTWSLPLSALPLKPLPDASAEALRAGNEHTCYVGRVTRPANPDAGETAPVVLTTGKKVTFKLPTGADQNKYGPQLQESNDRMLLSIRMKLISIEGVHENDLNRFLEDLDYDQFLRLRDDLDDADGGLDIDLTVNCPTCGNSQEMALPFDRDFFFPKRVKR